MGQPRIDAWIMDAWSVRRVDSPVFARAVAAVETWLVKSERDAVQIWLRGQPFLVTLGSRTG